MTDRLRVAVVELDVASRSATGDRGRALRAFLSRRHAVEVLAPSPPLLRDFERFRFSIWSRLKRRMLSRRSLPHIWDYVADDLAPRLRDGGYDVVIGRGPVAGYVLTRLGAGSLKILDIPNVHFLEVYHSSGADLGEVEICYEKEMALYGAADHVVLHHDILTRFFRQHVYDDPKVMTVRMGCEPSPCHASFSEMPRLVYAGSYDYIQDPYLLSLLAKQSPCPIECFGPSDPNRRFLPARLDYRGYRETKDFMADYQAGLVTVSADRLRRHSPSTKFAYYFSAGLPVLFPAWMEEGHTYDAAVPYTESDFPDRVREVVGNRTTWERLSERAIALSETLSWSSVLAPLDVLIESHPRSAAGS